MGAGTDPDTQRAELIERWERASAGWGRRVERIREWGMPVSVWMIDQLRLAPGQIVLELAGGPGDTGFMAAELVAPGGRLISSDATEGMLDVARARAVELGIANVEFKQLELEWVDLETASVDAVLCRWGVMLTVDPAAALHEVRRVLAPGGRFAMAVWDSPDRNPWATIPSRALISLGLVDPPDPAAPGMFALASEERLRGMLQDAGFLDVVVARVSLQRVYDDVEEFLRETLDMSMVFSEAMSRLDDDTRERVAQRIREQCEPLLCPDGRLRFPGSSIVAAADA